MLQDLLEGDSQHPLFKDQEAPPEMTDAQNHQTISVIPDDYCNLQCCKCRHECHSIFSCPYLSDAQQFYFAYSYYLFQVTEKPQIERYPEEKFHWWSFRDKAKSGVANTFIEKSSCSNKHWRCGKKRGNSYGPPISQTQWAPGGRGSTPYTHSA